MEPRRKLTDEARREAALAASNGDLEAARRLVRDIERERGLEPEADVYRRALGSVWSGLSDATSVIEAYSRWSKERHPFDDARTLALIEKNAQPWVCTLRHKIDEARKVLDGEADVAAGSWSVLDCLDDDGRLVQGSWLAASVEAARSMRRDRAAALEDRKRWFDACTDARAGTGP